MTRNIQSLWIWNAENGSSESHQTILYSDGQMDCGCVTFVGRAQNHGPEYSSCDHTFFVRQGTADSKARYHIHYLNVEEEPANQSVTTVTPKSHGTKSKAKRHEVGDRKFYLE